MVADQPFERDYPHHAIAPENAYDDSITNYCDGVNWYRIQPEQMSDPNGKARRGVKSPLGCCGELELCTCWCNGSDYAGARDAIQDSKSDGELEDVTVTLSGLTKCPDYGPDAKNGSYDCAWLKRDIATSECIWKHEGTDVTIDERTWNFIVLVYWHTGTGKWRCSAGFICQGLDLEALNHFASSWCSTAITCSDSPTTSGKGTELTNSYEFADCPVIPTGDPFPYPSGVGQSEEGTYGGTANLSWTTSTTVTPYFYDLTVNTGNTAQVDHVTPANIEIGDEFTMTIGGDDVEFVATATTPQDVVEGLKAAADTAKVYGNAWYAVTVTEDDSKCIVTADAAGVPFTLTTATVDGGGTDDQTLTRAESVANVTGMVSCSNCTQQAVVDAAIQMLGGTGELANYWPPTHSGGRSWRMYPKAAGACTWSSPWFQIPGHAGWYLRTQLKVTNKDVDESWWQVFVYVTWFAQATKNPFDQGYYCAAGTHNHTIFWSIADNPRYAGAGPYSPYTNTQNACNGHPNLAPGGSPDNFYNCAENGVATLSVVS